MKKKLLEIWNSNTTWILIAVAIAAFSYGRVQTLTKKVDLLERAVVNLIGDDNHQLSFDSVAYQKLRVLYHRDTVWYDRLKAIDARLREDSVSLSKPKVRYNFYFSDSTKVSFTSLGRPTVKGIK